MSGERALVDTKGKFVQVVKDGRKQNDIEWLPGRILLSNRRLVLATNDGKRTVPLSTLTGVTASQMNQPLAQVEGEVKSRPVGTRGSSPHRTARRSRRSCTRRCWTR